jgi:uncharacterized BrkB/YihY/UPF0761 family membrane protein
MGHVIFWPLPAVALVLGVRQGLYDARAGSPPFAVRGRLLSAVVVPLLTAVALVTVFRYLTLHRVRPLSALIVGGLMVWLPFVLVRALTNHLVTRAVLNISEE